MNDLTLPPSPNWYSSNICACSKDGTIAWGASNSIVIGRYQQNNKILNYSIIKDAHKERINSLAFSPEYGENNKNLLVSAGDECTVKIWNLDTNSTIMIYSYQNKQQTVIGVDWCIKNPNRIYCISNDGLLINWNISNNVCRTISLGKMTATCLCACPHDCNLVAVGSKVGLVYIVNTCGKNFIRYKLRGHDTEICSLSWCPVENNIISDENNKDFLLASGGKDRSIFLWKAGGDGRYELKIILPNSPLDPRHIRNKLNKFSTNWTSVCWANSTLLLTSSFWGELLAWDLKSDKNKPTPKLVHSCHNRLIFFICIVPNVNETINDNLEINDSITVWTLSQDRKIVCCNMKKDCNEIVYNIPSQGGFVYCLTSCPVETSRIAFGVGDAMLRIWNLSEEHITSVDITILWQKIRGSIRSVAWHPTKENLIAYGTSEGRIGVFDTNGNKSPILYRQYYRKTVYTLQWGPYLGTENYTLYSCGEGNLIYYTPDDPNKVPTVLIEKKCTELSWNPDFSCLAVGFLNGSIQFYNRDLKKCGNSINTANIPIYCLKWHPNSTTTDLTFSQFKNYMAVTYDEPTITILDLSDLIEKIDETNVSTELVNKVYDTEILSSKTFGKVYATLNGHSKKIVGLAWNPHLSGYLVSCSYDNTAQVWNVERQEVIATHVDHHGYIYCCMWSPIDPDVILTGSSDFTLRLWRISSQSVVMPEKKLISKDTSTKNKQKINKDNNTRSNNVSLIENINTPEVIAPEMPTEVSTMVEKKVKEKKSYFQINSKIMNNKSSILKSIKCLIKDEDNFLSSAYQLKEDAGLPSLFSENTNLSEIFNLEKSSLTIQNNHDAVTEMSMWHDNLKENLETAVKENRLNDYLVSLSPSLSMMTWREMCEAYANQLILKSNPTKAVSFLLCIHKIYEAIDVFQNAQMFKEAYCLARSKLDSNDEIIKKILQNWAQFEHKKGRYERAAHCYVKLEDYSEAASLLARRKDVESLIVASKLALLSNENTFSKSLVEQALMEALQKLDISVAENIIQSFPEIKYLEVLVKVFVVLQKTINKSINESTICAWIKGELEDGVLQICKDYCKEYKDYYNDLCQYSFNPIIDNQKILWINTSGQLAMAIISDSMENKLTHLINAFSIIYKFDQHRGIENRESHFTKVLVYLDSTSPLGDNSIYEQKSSLSKSLRAYLCVGLLNWIVDEDKNVSLNDQNIKIIELIEDVLEDILEKQTVRFWSVTNEISKLETQIFSTLGKTQKMEEASLIEDEAELVKKLDRIKNEKKQFIKERIDSPSPILAFTKANDLIDKFCSEAFITALATKLDKMWTNAISL